MNLSDLRDWVSFAFIIIGGAGAWYNLHHRVKSLEEKQTAHDRNVEARLGELSRKDVTTSELSRIHDSLEALATEVERLRERIYKAIQVWQVAILQKGMEEQQAKARRES